MQNLTIRVEDFNSIVQNPFKMKELRKLTLNNRSGMNFELNHLEKSTKKRKVYCQIILAYDNENIIAWALLSKENSKYRFNNSIDGYSPGQGMLFETFVHPSYRRQGIGTQFLKIARRKANNSSLCVCPWDEASENFYKKFSHYKQQLL